jgi:cellulose synthase/poly-beta-1,6-N-acetylglucosamine synthase-like glycosyltransferase
MELDIWAIISTVALFSGLFTSMFYILILLQKDPVYPPLKEYPSISVVVPFWNEGSNNGERMRKTVDSLLRADYPKNKLEIILVNDGSSDNSLDIAKEYEKKHGIKVFSNKTSDSINESASSATTSSPFEFFIPLLTAIVFP